MNLVLIAALMAACSAAKLDNTYLPPSAKTAGGNHEILLTPLAKSNQEDVPTGGYANEFQGIVVDAALADTRASNPVQTGLGSSRISYGSTDSKVGAAAFRDTATLNQNNIAGTKETTSAIPIAGFRQPQYPETDKPERIQAAKDRTSNILSYQNNAGLDNFNYAFETENGILTEVSGVVINGVKTQGGYSYTGDDGQIYSITYTADEGGYQPKGSHIPTPPPVPIEILEALERNAKDEAAGIIDDGSYDAQKYKTSSHDYTNNDNYRYQQRQSSYNQPRPNLNRQNEFYNKENQDRSPSYAGQYSNKNFEKESQISTSDTLKNNAESKFETTLNFENRVSLNAQSNHNLNSDQHGLENTKSSQDRGSELQQAQAYNPSPTYTIASVPTSYTTIGEATLPLSQQALQDQSVVNKSPATTSFARPSSYDIPLSESLPKLSSQIKPVTYNNSGAQNFNNPINEFKGTQNMQPSTFSSVSDITNVQSEFEAGSKPISSFINPYSISSSIGTQQIIDHKNSLPVNNQNSQPLRNQVSLSLSGVNSYPQSLPFNQLQTKFSTALQPNEPNSHYALTVFNNTKFENRIADNQYKYKNPINPKHQSSYHSTTEYSQTSYSGKPYFYGQASKPFGEQVEDKAVELSVLNPIQSSTGLNSLSENQIITGSNNVISLPSLILTTPKKDMFEIPNKTSFNGLTQASISSFPLITNLPSSYYQEPIIQFGSLKPQQLSQFHSSSTLSQLGDSNSPNKKLNIPSSQDSSSFADEIQENKKSEVQSPGSNNLGEIYEYKKPTLSLPSASSEQARPSQIDTPNMNIGFQINPQIGQKNNNMNGAQPVNQFPDTQQSQNNQFSQQNLNIESSNQFHIDQNKNSALPQVNFSRPKPLGSRPQSSPFGCCFISKPQKMENPSVPQFQNSVNIFGQTLTGNGEVFTSVHQRPSFDDSGYHY